MKVFQYLLFCITLLTFTSCVYNNLNRNHYLLSPDESLSLTLHGNQHNISYSLTKNGNTAVPEAPYILHFVDCNRAICSSTESSPLNIIDLIYLN